MEWTRMNAICSLCTSRFTATPFFLHIAYCHSIDSLRFNFWAKCAASIPNRMFKFIVSSQFFNAIFNFDNLLGPTHNSHTQIQLCLPACVSCIFSITILNSTDWSTAKCMLFWIDAQLLAPFLAIHWHWLPLCGTAYNMVVAIWNKPLNKPSIDVLAIVSVKNVGRIWFNRWRGPNRKLGYIDKMLPISRLPIRPKLDICFVCCSQWPLSTLSQP